MTQEEAIARWEWIVACVFTAEINIHDDWIDELKAAKKGNGLEITKRYFRAIAEEIVNNTPEEELKQMTQ